MPTNDFGLRVAIHRSFDHVFYSIWGELIPDPIRYEPVLISDAYEMSDAEISKAVIKGYFSQQNQ